MIDTFVERHNHGEKKDTKERYSERLQFLLCRCRDSFILPCVSRPKISHIHVSLKERATEGSFQSCNTKIEYALHSPGSQIPGRTLGLISALEMKLVASCGHLPPIQNKKNEQQIASPESAVVSNKVTDIASSFCPFSDFYVRWFRN